MKMFQIFLAWFICFSTQSFSSDKAIKNFNWDNVWIWEDTVNNQQTIIDLVKFYRSKNIKIGSVILDSPWATSYNDLKINVDRYPNISYLRSFLNKGDTAMVAWLTPYINIDHMPHNKFEVFIPYSHNELPMKWWKGNGYLIDFEKKGAYEIFFYQPQSDLNLFDGIKADQVAQFSPSELWFKRSISWIKAIGKYSRKHDLKVLARGYSHQGGLQSNSSDVDFNWGGDYSGKAEDISLQVNDLCKSMENGFLIPAFEAGGYNPPAANNSELEMALEIGSIFPVMLFGGKSWNIYKNLVAKNRDVLTALSRKQQVSSLISFDKPLTCYSTYLERGGIIAVFKPTKLKFDIINFNTGKVISKNKIINNGLYFKADRKFCSNEVNLFQGFKLLGKKVKTSQNEICISAEGLNYQNE